MPMNGLIFFSFPLEIKKEQNKVRNDDATEYRSWYQKNLLLRCQIIIILQQLF